MILWGIRGREKVLSQGTFFCPNCNAVREYKKKSAGNYFTLYFIPLFKVKDRGQYVECQTCKRVYDPGILQSGSQDNLKLVASARYALLHGTHPTALKSQLIASGVDAQAADRIIEMAQR